MTLPACTALQGVRCTCGGFFDMFGDHQLACKSGNERFVRHNALVRVFASIMERVGIRPMVEKRLTQLGIVENKPNERMDVVHLDRHTGLTCSDVSVRQPTAKSYVRAAAHNDGWAIRVAEAVKNRKYKQKVRAAGFRFQSLIAETEGRWSEHTQRFLRELAKPVADAAENNSVFVRNRMVDRGWKELGCALQKYNAYLILSRTVAANNFRPFELGRNTNTNTNTGLGSLPSGEGGLQQYFTPDWV